MGIGARRRLLDIGCGDGTFLLRAREKGWQVAGTEMNPQIAREAGLDVFESLAEAHQFAPFHCITLWHSLEHMRDPRAVIESVKSALAPTGSLIIAVPDADGLQARAFKENWLHLDVPRHLYHFGKGSLACLLDHAGFKVVRYWHQELEYDLLGWSQSALNRLMPMPNIFFNQLMGRCVEVGDGLARANYVLGAALTGLALPVVTASTLSKCGGTLITVARHKEDN
jgi:SAM-dependent methyltransferase